MKVMFLSCKVGCSQKHKVIPGGIKLGAFTLRVCLQLDPIKFALIAPKFKKFQLTHNSGLPVSYLQLVGFFELVKDFPLYE